MPDLETQGYSYQLWGPSQNSTTPDTLIANSTRGLGATVAAQTVVVPNPSGPSALGSFSTQFATAYRADPNSEPYTPADGDVPALSLTTEPVAVD